MKSLLPQFGIANATALQRRVTPTDDSTDFRHKVARAYRFIAGAGLGSRLVWGLALIIIAACLITAGLLFYATPLGLPVAVLGLLIVPIGVWVAMSCDANKIESQLRLFQASCNDAGNAWRTSAQANSESATGEIREAVRNWVHSEFIAGKSIPDTREQLNATVEAAGQLATEVESALAAANQRLKESRESLAQSEANFRTVVAKKSSRSRVRMLARRVVATIEECVRREHEAIDLDCAVQFLRKSIEYIVATRNSVQNLEGSLRALSQEISVKKRELAEMSKTESLAGKTLPSLEDVFAQGAEAASAHSQEVLTALAAQGDGQVREVMESAIQQGITDAGVLPETFDAWWAAADEYRRQMLLEGIDTGANEFAVTKPIPGRVQQRIRHVLAYGGTACPAFDPVKTRSNSLLCRAINHADPSELLVVTESRYEPASEIVEFVACAKTFDAMSRETQSLAITVVDDDSEITDYKPESRSDPERPYRLLVLGLLSGEIVRTGAEQYRERDVTNPKNGHFAKGFEDAACAIRTDSDLSTRLEKRVNQRFDTDGQAAVLSRIRDAFASDKVVPSAALPRFRQVLLDEYQLRGGNVRDLSANSPSKVRNASVKEFDRSSQTDTKTDTK